MGTAFFAENAVVRPAALDRFDDEIFHSDIGFGNEVFVALAADSDIGQTGFVLQRDGSCLKDNVVQKFFILNSALRVI